MLDFANQVEDIIVKTTKLGRETLKDIWNEYRDLRAQLHREMKENETKRKDIMTAIHDVNAARQHERYVLRMRNILIQTTRRRMKEQYPRHRISIKENVDNFVAMCQGAKTCESEDSEELMSELNRIKSEAKELTIARFQSNKINEFYAIEEARTLVGTGTGSGMAVVEPMYNTRKASQRKKRRSGVTLFKYY